MQNKNNSRSQNSHKARFQKRCIMRVKTPYWLFLYKYTNMLTTQYIIKKNERANSIPLIKTPDTVTSKTNATPRAMVWAAVVMRAPGCVCVDRRQACKDVNSIFFQNIRGNRTWTYKDSFEDYYFTLNYTPSTSCRWLGHKTTSKANKISSYKFSLLIAVCYGNCRN